MSPLLSDFSSDFFEETWESEEIFSELLLELFLEFFEELDLESTVLPLFLEDFEALDLDSAEFTLFLEAFEELEPTVLPLFLEDFEALDLDGRDLALFLEVFPLITDFLEVFLDFVLDDTSESLEISLLLVSFDLSVFLLDTLESLEIRLESFFELRLFLDPALLGLLLFLESTFLVLSETLLLELAESLIFPVPLDFLDVLESPLALDLFSVDLVSSLSSSFKILGRRRRPSRIRRRNPRGFSCNWASAKLAFSRL